MASALIVNDERYRLPDDPRVSLLDHLRHDLGLTRTKNGCDHGQSGVCTIDLNGLRLRSCHSLAVMHDGDEIPTMEGLGTPQAAHLHKLTVMG